MEINISVPDSFEGLDVDAARALLTQVSAALISLHNVSKALDAQVYAPQRVQTLVLEYLTNRDGKQPSPEDPTSVFPPWQQPSGAHDSYPEGYLVTHNNKVWLSITPNNAHEPGVSGWREETTNNEPAAWVQPAGAHDAYMLGDFVTHNGQTWECTQVSDGVNAFEPGVWGWTVVS